MFQHLSAQVSSIKDLRAGTFSGQGIKGGELSEWRCCPSLLGDGVGTLWVELRSFKSKRLELRDLPNQRGQKQIKDPGYKIRNLRPGDESKYPVG